nr:hypothetical protein [uncultured bacterium]
MADLVPPPDEFLARGFACSATHNPSHLTSAYTRSYPGQLELTLVWGPVSTDFHAELRLDGEIASSVSVGEVTSVAFQSWHSEQIVRVYCRSGGDLRVHYNPRPRIHAAFLG